MGRSPSEIEQWPHSDLVRLMAYDHIQPFGYERDNWHMAVQATLFASAHTPKNKPKPQVKDFMYVDPLTKQRTETKSFFSKLSAKAKKHGN